MKTNLAKKTKNDSKMAETNYLVGKFANTLIEK